MIEAEARAALTRRDWRGALELLGARPIAALTVAGLLDKALAQRMLGDLEGSIASLRAVLVLEPRNFLALLSQGVLFERLQRRPEAGAAFKAAIACAPPPEALPAALAAPLDRARHFVSAQADALAAYLRESLAPLLGDVQGAARDRFEEGLDIYAGRKRAFVQQPLQLNYPRLPAIPFHERQIFPWLEALEAATATVHAELCALLEGGVKGFAPYIQFPPGVPLNQWAELNHSTQWSTYFLWRDGERQVGGCEACPETAALLDSLPLAKQPGFAPTAMFSALDARGRIPAHTGSSNARLIVHLPLILPGPAFFRVGNVTRPWRVGEAWVFDDTIEHEAWNEADERRTILIFDVWNPFVSEAERALLSAMMIAARAFDGGS